MPARFDHAVVIVPSLKRAVQSFERLGFCVVLGGRTGPVHNAVIFFSDGTYIELTTNRFSVVRPVYRPRAYPHNVLWWHEVANVDVGGEAFAVTLCPLTGSGLRFDRRGFVDGQTVRLGVSVFSTIPT
jgi:hypothetical protein